MHGCTPYRSHAVKPVPHTLYSHLQIHMIYSSLHLVLTQVSITDIVCLEQKECYLIYSQTCLSDHPLY